MIELGWIIRATLAVCSKSGEKFVTLDLMFDGPPILLEQVNFNRSTIRTTVQIHCHLAVWIGSILSLDIKFAQFLKDRQESVNRCFCLPAHINQLQTPKISTVPRTL